MRMHREPARDIPVTREADVIVVGGGPAGLCAARVWGPAGSMWDTEHHRPMRNASCTTIAPTGSLSILAQCSAGIEPIYSLAYRRRALDGREFIQVHPLMDRIGRRDGWMNDAVRKALLDGIPATAIEGIPRRLAEALVTAHQVSPEWHVRMQAAFQAHTENAVSKTVNLPADATLADVDTVFRLATSSAAKARQSTETARGRDRRSRMPPAGSTGSNRVREAPGRATG